MAQKNKKGPILEALFFLLIARLALQLFPFKRVVNWMVASVRGPERKGEVREQARQEVGGAIRAIHRRYPSLSTCLYRAIAAQAMLRRRGVSVTLYYGARTLTGRGLVAHAWVMDGEQGVIGHWVARKDKYHLLARYPEPE